MKNPNSGIPLCLGIVIWASSCWGQLYLITGSQSPKSPEGSASVLFRVGLEGQIDEIEEIVPQSVGTWFIGTSYDARKLVAFSPGHGATRAAQATVVDFDG